MYCLSLVCLVCFVFVLFRSQHCSVIQSCSTLCDPHGLQHTRLPCPSPSPRACLNSCPLSLLCHSTISSSISVFSPYLQSFSASGSFSKSWLFASGGPSIGLEAPVTVHPMHTQGLFPLGLISLHSKGLSSVFSNTTV